MGLKPRKKTTEVRTIRTDTASCVVFDPDALRHRLADRCDWWSAPSEELKELNQGNALFLPLHADGLYQVSVTKRASFRGLRAFLRNTSGEFFVGPGECVIGDGYRPKRSEGRWIRRKPGVYEVMATLKVPNELEIAIMPSDQKSASNSFVSCPTSLDPQPRPLPPTTKPPSRTALAPMRPSELTRALGKAQSSSAVGAVLSALGDPDEQHGSGNEITCSFTNQGIELRLVAGALETVFLYDKCRLKRDRDTGLTVHGAFERYPYDLPCGLSFGMSGTDVRAALGPTIRKYRGDWSSHRLAAGEIVARYRKGKLYALDLRAKPLA
jgi:hypothetical protein